MRHTLKSNPSRRMILTFNLAKHNNKRKCTRASNAKLTCNIENC
ncbi:hypothetical protein HMPREF3190_01006 [Umbribacter vaginalis]|nr:hypothetical protein HMPREF3190_01006 [Coriobacteriales bacterium DNF00809]